MPRRVRFIVVLGVVSMVLVIAGIRPGSSGEDIAATEEEISEAQERLMEIRSEESDALARKSIALHKMNEAQRGDSDAEKDLQAAEEDLAEAQAALEERASQVYRSGNVGFVDVLVGVDDFSQFAARSTCGCVSSRRSAPRGESVPQAKNEIEDRKSGSRPSAPAGSRRSGRPWITRSTPPRPRPRPRST